MTQQSTDQTYTDYLPELDSVSTGRGMVIVAAVGWIVLSAILGALCGGVYALVRVNSRMDVDWMVFAMISAACAVVGAVLMARTNWFDCQWTTDSAGLTVRGPFHERRIQWSEITQAVAKTSMGELMVVTVRTSSRKMATNDSTGGLIGASIYQHLRKYGKSDESLLSPSARTLWTPIPSEVPLEMDWHNPHPPDWPLTLVAVLLVLIAVPLAYYLGPRVRWGDAWSHLHQFAAAVIPLGYFKFRERLIAARTVSVRHDGIEMRTARRMVYVPWRDIGCVQWHQQHKALTIGRSSFSDVGMIVYRADDPASGTLILAIIRQLRSVHHAPPVAIPKLLLPMLGVAGAWLAGGSAGGEPVVVRPASGALLLLPLTVLITGAVIAFLVWPTGILPTEYLAAIAVAGLLLIGALLRAITQVYRADSEGITVTSIGRRKNIRWQEVAQYVVKPVAGTSIVRRILKDSSGRFLLALPLPQGSRADIDLFLAYADARLASVRQDDTRVLMR